MEEEEHDGRREVPFDGYVQRGFFVMVLESRVGAESQEDGEDGHEAVAHDAGMERGVASAGGEVDAAGGDELGEDGGQEGVHVGRVLG